MRALGSSLQTHTLLPPGCGDSAGEPGTLSCLPPKQRAPAVESGACVRGAGPAEGAPEGSHLGDFDHLPDRVRDHGGVVFQARWERERSLKGGGFPPTHTPRPPATHPTASHPRPACLPARRRTYLRCRSMLAEDSSMAVGLAMFLPTAWAKGCRAPCKGRGGATCLGPPGDCACSESLAEEERGERGRCV